MLDGLKQMCTVWTVETMTRFLLDDAGLNLYQLEHTKEMGILKFFGVLSFASR